MPDTRTNLERVEDRFGHVTRIKPVGVDTLAKMQLELLCQAARQTDLLALICSSQLDTEAAVRELLQIKQAQFRR